MLAMAATNRHGIPAKILHWSMAALIIFNLGLAPVMTSIERGDTKWAMFGLHKSLGVLILVLGLLRLIRRAASKSPEWAESLTDGERRYIGRLERVLYALIIAVPAAGLLMSLSHGRALEVFKLFEIPSIGEFSAFGVAMDIAHKVFATALVAAIAMHISFVWRHTRANPGYIRRMWPGGK